MIALQRDRRQLLLAARQRAPGHFRELGRCRRRPQILQRGRERYPQRDSKQKKFIANSLGCSDDGR